jgi:hypothetical protein
MAVDRSAAGGGAEGQQIHEDERSEERGGRREERGEMARCERRSTNVDADVEDDVERYT